MSAVPTHFTRVKRRRQGHPLRQDCLGVVRSAGQDAPANGAWTITGFRRRRESAYGCPPPLPIGPDGRALRERNLQRFRRASRATAVANAESCTCERCPGAHVRRVHLWSHCVSIRGRHTLDGIKPLASPHRGRLLRRPRVSMRSCANTSSGTSERTRASAESNTPWKFWRVIAVLTRSCTWCRTRCRRSFGRSLSARLSDEPAASLPAARRAATV